jgi:hypothetical protein
MSRAVEGAGEEHVSELNSHIRMHGPMPLICDNPVPYLNQLRDGGNKPGISGPDRIERRREKFDFADFVARTGARAPRTFALVQSGMVKNASSGSTETVASFLTNAPHGHYFCKPNTGRNGVGAFWLTSAADGVMMDEELSSIGAVSERLSSADYVIQEWMAPLQHPDISRFRGGVINTMRLITFDAGDGAKAVAASLRMAISLKSIDSWSQGGVVAAIDLDRGVLKPFGIMKKGAKIVDAHPGSGIRFRDQPIPHFWEALTLACRMHSQFAGPRSLGWDIGLLKDGPCFLESNGPWDVLMSAQFNPDLVPKFLAFLLPPTCETAVHVLLPGTYANRMKICLGLSRGLGRAMASGRVERLTRDRLVLTIGGTQQAVQTALRLFKERGPNFGATGVKIRPAQDKPAPGFDASGLLPGDSVTESARPE